MGQEICDSAGNIIITRVAESNRRGVVLLLFFFYAKVLKFWSGFVIFIMIIIFFSPRTRLPWRSLTQACHYKKQRSLCQNPQIPTHLLLFLLCSRPDHLPNSLFILRLSDIFVTKMGEAVEVFVANGFANLYEKTDKTLNIIDNHKDSCWYEEVIDEDLKWSFALNRFV